MEMLSAEAGKANRCNKNRIISRHKDPFILEGLVKSFVIRDCNETMLE